MGILNNGRIINNLKLSEDGKKDFRMPKMSKSRFVTGLQCVKSLYYSCYHNEYRDKLTEEQKAIFQRGTDIGVEAQKVYPGGELISEDFRQVKQALEHTKNAMEKMNANDIYEAAFEADDIVVRADIIHRCDGKDDSENCWDLIEVKSSMSVKDVNIRDVGIQLYVMEKCGVKVNDAILMHMTRDYDYRNPDWSDPVKNFVKANITENARNFASEIPELLTNMQEVISKRDVEPSVEVGNQCLSPYRCAFYGHCHPEEKGEE